MVVRCMYVSLDFCRIYTPFHEQKGISTAEKAGHAFLNAIIVIAVVLVMTILLVILYIKKCYKVSNKGLLIEREVCTVKYQTEVF